ncbi:hypothetical protein ABK040_004191 [Willaertia magna]
MTKIAPLRKSNSNESFCESDEGLSGSNNTSSFRQSDTSYRKSSYNVNNVSLKKEDEVHYKFYKSMRFCIVSLVVLFTLVCVIFVSGFWIGNYLLSVFNTLNKTKNLVFSNMLDRIVSTTARAEDVTIVVGDLLQSNNFNLTTKTVSTYEKQLDKLFGHEMKYQPALQSVYIGNGEVTIGMMKVLNDISYVYIYGDIHTGYWIEGFACVNYTTISRCERTVTPQTRYPATIDQFANLGSFVSMVGRPFWTLSYADPSLPNLIYITFMVPFLPPSGSVAFAKGDLSIYTLSEILKVSVSVFNGAEAALIEVATENVIAKENMKGEKGGKKSIEKKPMSLDILMQKFELGVERKEITILGIKVSNFDLFLQELTLPNLFNFISEIFQVVQHLEKTSKSQIGNFDNGILPLIFNGGILQQDHILKAAKTAELLKKKLEVITKKWNMRDSSCELPLAVVTERVVCGNLGTENSKSFTVLGGVHNNLSEVFKFNEKYRIAITLNESALKVCGDAFNTRPLGTVKLRNDFNIMESSRIYELGDSKEIKMDEWMYELQQQEVKGKWNSYCEGYSLFEEGNFSQALEKFNEFEEKNTDDLVVSDFIAICKHQMNLHRGTTKSTSIIELSLNSIFLSPNDQVIVNLDENFE